MDPKFCRSAVCHGHDRRECFAISMISVAEYGPIFLFAFIGVFADRWRPKATIVWCEILSACSVFIVFLMLESGSWGAVFFATLCSSILSQFAQPSGMKLFKIHVPDEYASMGMSARKRCSLSS